MGGINQKLIVPAGIFVESYVEDIKRKDKRLGLIDAMHLILHYMNQYQYVHVKEFLISGDVPINVDMLRKITGKNNADGALEILQDQNVITKTKNHIKQLHQSAKYKFTEKLVNHKTRKVQVQGVSLKKHLQGQEISEKDKMMEADLKIPHLTKFLKSDKLSFDWAAANYWIQEYDRLFNLKLTEIVKQYPLKDRVSKRKKLQIANNLKLLFAYANVQKIADGKITYEISKTNNRLTSNIVLMAKSLRNFIKYDGELLVEIDINASQPHILHYLLNNVIERKKASNIININHSLSISDKDHQALYIHLIPVTLKWSKELDNELDVYSSLFDSGDFYENIGNFINEKNGKPIQKFKNRESTKKQIMYLFFESFKKNGKRFQNVFLAFKNAFPAITDAMELMKPVEHKNQLAIMLQRIESQLVLEKITKVISDEVPDAPLFTIHDAILTTPTYKNKVKTVFERELNNIFQHRVRIKEKEFVGSDINLKISEEIENDIPRFKKKIRGNKTYAEYDVKLIRYVNETLPRWKGNGIFSAQHWDETLMLALQQRFDELENDPDYIAQLKNQEILENQYYLDNPE